MATIARTKPAHIPALPRSLAEVAWLEIREAILTGDLRPGEPIALKEQAERLGMSIMPVREALQRLHQEGLVVYEPQRGAMVAPLSVSHMEDIYRVRIELEGLAIELACKRFGPIEHQALSRLLDRFVEAYNRGDTRAGRELHRQFHLELYALADSPTLSRLIPPLIDASERYRVLSVRVRGSVEERRKEHQEILDACLQQDGQAARRKLSEHLRRTVVLARRALEALGAEDNRPPVGGSLAEGRKERSH